MLHEIWLTQEECEAIRISCNFFSCCKMVHHFQPLAAKAVHMCRKYLAFQQ